MRKFIGRIIEWFIGYDHEVVVSMDAGAVMPFHKYPGDAGYDLYCNEKLYIKPGATREVKSGIYMDCREQIWLEIKARSSTLKVKGLEVVDAVIDRDYRGELLAIIHNPTVETQVVEVGDRVIQIVPHRLVPLCFRIGKLSDSPRNTKGFGSTGV